MRGGQRYRMAISGKVMCLHRGFSFGCDRDVDQTDWFTRRGPTGTGNSGCGNGNGTLQGCAGTMGHSLGTFRTDRAFGLKNLD